MTPARSRATAPLLDPEALSLVRADAIALHATVRLTGPQPTGSPKFPQDRLAQLFSEVGKFGFDSFTLLPIGAQLATLPSRQAIVALESTLLTEQFAISGSSLKPFSELATELFDRVQSVLGVEGYRSMQLKLVAIWPLHGVDAMQFVKNAVKVKETASLSLGVDFDVAGVRFHKGKLGQQEEWNLKIEPLLQQPDKLWIELDLINTKAFRDGNAIAERFDAMERFLRTQVKDAVFALAGNRKGT